MTMHVIKTLPTTIAPMDRREAQNIGLFLQEISQRVHKPLWLRVVYELPYFTCSLEEAPQMETVTSKDGEPPKQQLRPPKHYMGGKFLLNECPRFFTLVCLLLAAHGVDRPDLEAVRWECASAISPDPNDEKSMLAALHVLILPGIEHPYNAEALELLVQMVQIGELTLPIVIRMYELAETRPRGDLLELIKDAFVPRPTAPAESISS